MSSWFQPVWDRLTSGYPHAASFAANSIAEVEKAYGGKRRYYHNADHILSMLALSEAYRPQLKTPLLVDFAIVYHDLVYNVLRKDNEAGSGLIAAKRLTALGMHPYEAGAPPEAYEAYARAVRREYRIYPDLLYNPGRKQFLEKTLAAQVIFHTPEFHARFDAAARHNMQKELQYLCGK